MPDIDAVIYQKYKEQGVLVYGVHGGEPAFMLEDFLEQTGVSYPLIKDQGTLNQFSFPPGVGYPYPRDVVIGKDLTVHSIKNSFNAGEMEALVEKLLAQ